MNQGPRNRSGPPRAQERLKHCGCKMHSPRPDATDGALVKGFQDSKNNMSLW